MTGSGPAQLRRERRECRGVGWSRGKPPTSPAQVGKGGMGGPGEGLGHQAHPAARATAELAIRKESSVQSRRARAGWNWHLSLTTSDHPPWLRVHFCLPNPAHIPRWGKADCAGKGTLGMQCQGPGGNCKPPHYQHQPSLINLPLDFQGPSSSASLSNCRF